jgi:hypothetical protein
MIAWFSKDVGIVLRQHASIVRNDTDVIGIDDTQLVFQGVKAPESQLS